MKTYVRILMILGLALVLFSAISCSKDSKPTTPNFEEFAPYVWDYENVLWFNLSYDTKLGAAVANVWLTSKGMDDVSVLKINNQDIDFDYMQSYTEGKFYSGGFVEINTTQPVTYEITKGDKEYTGNMELPDEVMGNFPAYVETNNFAPSWSITGDIDPDFQLVSSYISGEDGIDRNYVRQIAGSERNYSLLSTFWQDMIPISEFGFAVEAIVYKMKNSNKVLTVGVSSDDYYWGNDSKTSPVVRKANSNKILELIHNAQN